MSYDILDAAQSTLSIKSTTDSGDEVPHVNVDAVSGTVTVSGSVAVTGVSGTTTTRQLDGGTSVLVSLSTATGITVNDAVIAPASGKKVRIHDIYFAGGGSAGFNENDFFNITLFQGTPIGGGATSFVGFTAQVNTQFIGLVPKPIVFPVDQEISVSVQHLRVVSEIPTAQGTTWVGGMRIFYDEVD